MNRIAVVRDFIDAWNRRDRPAIMARLDPQVTVHGIPLPPAHGIEAAMALLDLFLDAEEIDWRIAAIAACDRLVLTERIDRFRFAGTEWSEVRAAGMFEVSDDGRITAWRDYFDMAELVAAVPPDMQEMG